LRERSKRLKRTVKQLKSGRGNPAKLANEARRAGYEIVGQWAERGVLSALDADLKEILVITPESLVLPLPETKAKVKQLQLELGVSDDDIQGWEKAYQWDKGKLLEAIRKQGSEMLWRQWLAESFSGIFTPSARFVPLAPWFIYLLATIVRFISHADPVGIGGECVPSPCPGQTPPPTPPPPPPSGPGCFVQGTLVATARGSKPIQKIRSGDGIYAFDLSAKDAVVQKVMETFRTRGEEIFLLDFGAEEICCTPLHRFYTGQWVHAKELNRGDRILSLEGLWIELKGIRREIEPQPVFNLHVDKIHNYFVGQVGLLVHNSKTPSDAVKEETNIVIP
jgi:hypothetical protein